MKRKTRKVKKEGDTRRDCWIKRFRKDIMKEYDEEIEGGHRNLTLPEFLNHGLQTREDAVKKMREEFGDMYDEISAIQDLAGDVYMGRLDAEDKED